MKIRNSLEVASLDGQMELSAYRGGATLVIVMIPFSSGLFMMISARDMSADTSKPKDQSSPRHVPRVTSPGQDSTIDSSAYSTAA
ncbi:hypothetical protein RRF57_011579 [Xylaria bambusicola]|uniref:Uncharacterized protein n=1 Tax=Xylaria bambusicola TaxID=326684 RepID=A0AAN7ZA22_9PEZI